MSGGGSAPSAPHQLPDSGFGIVEECLQAIRGSRRRADERDGLLRPTIRETAK